MKIKYKNTIEDYIALRMMLDKELYKRQFKVIVTLETMLIIFLSVVCFTINRYFGAIVLVVGLSMFWLIYPRKYNKICERGIRKNILRKDSNNIFLMKSFEFNEHGIFIEQGDLRNEIDWSRVSSCKVDERGVIIILDHINGLLIPKAVFKENDINSFYEMVNMYSSKAVNKEHEVTNNYNVFRTLTYKINQKQFIKEALGIDKKPRERFKRKMMIVVAIILCGVGMIFVRTVTTMLIYLAISLIVIFGAVPKGVDMLIEHISMYRAMKAGNVLCKDKSIVLSDDGIYYYGAGSRIFTEWHEITEYKLTKNYIFIEAGSISTFPVARSVFFDKVEEDKFLGIIGNEIHKNQ